MDEADDDNLENTDAQMLEVSISNNCSEQLFHYRLQVEEPEPEPEPVRVTPKTSKSLQKQLKSKSTGTPKESLSQSPALPAELMK